MCWYSNNLVTPRETCGRPRSTVGQHQTLRKTRRRGSALARHWLFLSALQSRLQYCEHTNEYTTTTTTVSQTRRSPLTCKELPHTSTVGPKLLRYEVRHGDQFLFHAHHGNPGGKPLCSPRHAWGVLPPSVDSLSHGVHISRREKVCRDDPTFLQKFGVVRPDATRG